MANEKNATSYLDEIGSGKDAVNVDGEQIGKEHEEEVAASNNWENDERDDVGRAADIQERKKVLAKKLLRISRELEALGKIEDEYAEGVDEMSDKNDDDFDYDYDDDDDSEETKPSKEKSDTSDPMAMEMGTESDEWLDPSGKEAAHPIEHGEDNVQTSPSTMGDDEWISIGPGTFNDARDQVERAGK